MINNIHISEPKNLEHLLKKFETKEQMGLSLEMNDFFWDPNLKLEEMFEMYLKNQCKYTYFNNFYF